MLYGYNQLIVIVSIKSNNLIVNCYCLDKVIVSYTEIMILLSFCRKTMTVKECIYNK